MTGGGQQWTAFDTSTEAGRLLKRLYGGVPSANITYPRPLPKREKQFIPGGAKLTARDPRQTKPKVTVKAPRRVAKAPEIHAIDVVQRRRTSSAIQRDLADRQMRNEAYRPLRRCFTGEKERLQEKFQFGGGKGLPDEMLPGKGPIPSELRDAQKEQLRIQKAWQDRQAGKTSKPDLIPHISSDDIPQYRDANHPSRRQLEISHRISELESLLRKQDEVPEVQ